MALATVHGLNIRLKRSTHQAGKSIGSNMAKVIPIRPIQENQTIYATCPECDGQAWLLPVNGYGDEWDKITGSECAGCGYIIDWVTVKKEGDNA
jgi:hypothetical protein